MVSQRRAGFGLAEVIVALVILAVGVLAAAALASAAAALLRATHAEETAVDGAAALMDSLRLDAEPTGELHHGGVHYSWQIRDAELRDITLRARFPAGGRERLMWFGARADLP